MPPNNSIKSIKFINDNTGFVIGIENTIVKTTNTGLTWKFITTDYDINYNSSQFLDVNTGFVIGNNAIFKTMNGGLNWQYLFSSVYGMHFIDYNTGYAVNSSYLYKTTNGGINWSTVSPVNAREVYFINSVTGFAGDSYMYKTTNSGLNWSTIEGIGPFLQLESFIFVNSSTGFAVGANGKIFKTVNGGDNWITLVSGTTEYLNSITFYGPNTGFVCGDNVLLKTTNSGNSWFNSYNNNFLFNSVSFSNSTTIYVGGFHGAFYKSTDEGNSWYSAVTGPRNNLKSVFFPSMDTGYCAGYGGAIINTTNAGNKWNLLNTGVTYNFNSVFFKDNSTGYAVADSGRIITTTNGGINWVNLISGVNTNLNSISSTNTSTLFICGQGGTILKSTNNGLSWNQLTSGVSVNLNSVFFADENTGYCTGGNVVIKSTNGGQNWSVKFTVTSSPSDLLSTYFTSNLNGYVTGIHIHPTPPHFQVTYILKTSNGGENWLIHYEPDHGAERNGSNSVFFVNENTGYVTSGGMILRTIDNGNNWVILKPVTSFDRIYSIFFTSQYIGYAVGTNGTILKTIDMGGPILNLTGNSTNIPNFLSLSQNYPNPFNPQTKIKFAVPSNVKDQTTNVKLVIYDLLGREVTTLVNEELKPGTYEADWDASNYSSGVYFYKLIAGDFVETKKMILMK
ncbi:MAG: T9SS type A sorting domain-containing protein [Ignavibacteria bacterium]|nr:T9SS type A sorting domain-containing protein [Ignavibacteria bacterium]